MTNTDDSPETDFDPRPVTDSELREEYTREQVQRWRDQADEAHQGWFSVLDNQYGKD
ncbi:hypothetical protein [Arhodomonas sp. SL1]|uniref:hypothetical protein n=1 Tax=Arhodomonas sp. SL1 TaxID=3425691 RepID=UPI003F882683